MSGVQRVFWSHSTCQSEGQLDRQDKDRTVEMEMSNATFNTFTPATIASRSTELPLGMPWHKRTTKDRF